MSYLALKQLHMVLAALSLTGFCLRGVWMLRGSALLAARWVRIAPHFVDTALAVTGIWLAVLLHLSPLAHPWLGAKLCALLGYIVLGAIALRRGRSRRIRALALAGALALAAYIVAAALSHRALVVL